MAIEPGRGNAKATRRLLDVHEPVVLREIAWRPCRVSRIGGDARSEDHLNRRELSEEHPGVLNRNVLSASWVLKD